MPKSKSRSKEESRQGRFETLLETHQGILFKVAHTYCRRPEDRADLAQEIRAQLWRSFPTFDERRAFSTWMYRVALNVAITFIRRAGKDQSLQTSLESAGIEPADERASREEPDDRVHALRRFIERLDPLNRALMLLYLEENSYREIAEVLGISETNVATKINRMKRRIRKAFHINDAARKDEEMEHGK